MNPSREWASIERRFLQEEIKRFESGYRVLDSSGSDVTDDHLRTLKSRLEHADKVIREANDAQGS